MESFIHEKQLLHCVRIGAFLSSRFHVQVVDRLFLSRHFSLFFPNDYIRGPLGLCGKRDKAKEKGNLELSNAKGKRVISWQQNHSCSQCSHSRIFMNSNGSINCSFKVIIICPLVAFFYFFRLKAVHTL